jgi:4-amino-4-deoxy-L-arabinose transferase-like glycosyltransferase
MPHDVGINPARPNVVPPGPFGSPLGAGADLADRLVRISGLAWAALKARWITIGLLVCFLLPGLVGHDPWKPDEAHTFGVVFHIFQSGDWVVPMLGGEPFMEKPTFFYVVAALFANMLSPWLALHDGARMAGGAFIAAGLLFTGLTARRLFGPGRGTQAMLILAGTLGLVQHAHEMITDTALFAGFAIAFYGLSFANRRPVRAGALIGTGVGIGFLSKGLVEPVMMGAACLALPAFFRTWRTANYRKTLVVAGLAVLPWLLIWPTALYLRSPEEFMVWFWTNNFGRFLGFANLGADTEPWYYTQVLPWFTFPAGPLAVWALAKRRRGIMADGALQMPLTVAAAILLVLTTSATARSLYALPLLIPLAVLASSLTGNASAAVTRWGARLAAILFGLLGVFLWTVWGYGVVHEAPPNIQLLLAKLPADFGFEFSWPHVAGALAVTALWLYLHSTNERSVSWAHRWAASICLVWGLGMTLLLPWLDYAKSFRSPFDELAVEMGDSRCLSSIGLGEPQRGMLDYFLGIKSARQETHPRDCPFLMVQTNNAAESPDVLRQDWVMIWQGGRPGETDERFSLFQRREDIALRNIPTSPGRK